MKNRPKRRKNDCRGTVHKELNTCCPLKLKRARTVYNMMILCFSGEGGVTHNNKHTSDVTSRVTCHHQFSTPAVLLVTGVCVGGAIFMVIQNHCVVSVRLQGKV